MAKRASKKKIYERLYRAILKHGTAKIVLEQGQWNWQGNGRGKYTWGHETSEYGQRLMRKNGKCKVSYSGSYRYKKSYSSSCFVDDYLHSHCCNPKSRYTKTNLAKSLREMMKHDGSRIRIKSIHVGRNFRKEISLDK